MKVTLTVEEGNLKYDFEADNLKEIEGILQRIGICLKGPQYDPSKSVSQQKQIVPHFSYLATSITRG